MSTSPSTTAKLADLAFLPCVPPVAAVAEDSLRKLGRLVYVPEYVNLENVQKCLEDRRSRLVPVDSATFNSELQLMANSCTGFFVLEKDHFVRFSRCYPPVKFSYKSRGAAMTLQWTSPSLVDIPTRNFVEVDGLWQMEQPPVLYFVFGDDADILRPDFLADGNTIYEYYESTVSVDMAKLAVVAQSKTDLCVSHFFVVNRGKDYWAVDTRDPSISYAFDPTAKSRTISRLAN
ncbi:hypothetical protein IWW38_006394, partial [Coemansia aciculifera]